MLSQIFSDLDHGVGQKKSRRKVLVKKNVFRLGPWPLSVMIVSECVESVWTCQMRRNALIAAFFELTEKNSGLYEQD